MLNIRLFQAALALYGIGTLGYLVFLATQRGGAARIARIATGLGALAHTGFFLARWAASGYFPITNLFESLNFFSWAIVVAFILLQIRLTAAVLGALVLPIAFSLAAFSLTLDGSVAPLVPALQSRWLYVHTTLAFIGDAFFVIAFAGGVLYLVQERQLKSRHTGAFFHRLPSLDLLDRVNYRSLTFGFPLLTLGIITGAIWAENAWGSYWQWDPKETWSLITWFIYAALVHARLTVGWRGRKAAWLSIVGFLAVLFTFLGVNLLLGGLHSYASK
jgi:cytochrome c-type biogenesis protein CcsB